MFEYWSIALPILAADIANPALLSAAVAAAASTRPRATSLAVVLGHTLAYFLLGVAIVYGFADLAARWLAPVVDRLNSPQDIDFLIGLVLGLILIGVALRWRVSPPEASGRPASPFGSGVGGAFVLGAAVSFAGAPFALPYLAFLSQLDRLAPEQTLTALAAYNLAYALPFLAVPLSLAVAGRSVLPVLGKAVSTVDRLSGFVPPVLLGLVGVGLLLDAALFFATGTGLI